jgi:protocatechuate 3,4-dioxygenase beta subunit
VTPLASWAAAKVIDLPDEPGPVKLDEVSAGLTLVCAGGENVAVACEQKYLEPGETLVPKLAKGVKVIGTLRRGKAPLAGARLAVVPKELKARRFLTLPLFRDAKGSPLVREIASDRAGRFTLPQLAPGEYLLQVRAPGGRIHHQEVSVPRPEALLPKGRRPAAAEATLDLGEIALEEGLSVAVFVTGPGGAPIAGAKVGAGQGDRPETTVIFETVADREGKAVLAGLAPAGLTRITCLTEGYAVLQQNFEAPPLTVSCALEPLARIEGSVVDGQGEPVSSATVSGPALRGPATTDKDGRFELFDLAAGHYELAVAASGFRTERRRVELAAGERRSLPAIELAPGREARGLVRDARSQEPVASATITSVDPSGAVATVSDAQGEFTFSVGGEEPLQLRVEAAGYPRTAVEVRATDLEEDEPFTIDLREGGRVHALVWDEEADTPCQGCPLGLQGPAGSERLVTDGRGEALSEPLAEGRYYVSLNREQSLGTIIRVQGGTGGKRVDVLAGQVTPVQFGERRPPLQVIFRPPAPDAWKLLAETSTGQRLAERLEDGSFRVRKPGGGAVTLKLHGNSTVSVRQAVVPADDESPVIELPLPQGHVRGVLVAGERPAAGRILQLVSAADSTLRASLRTAADGSFSISFLAPGPYLLLVEGKPLVPVAVGDQEKDLGSVPLPAP